MGAYEFAMWQEYHKIDPFGNERGDLQAAIVASAAVAPHSKKTIKPSAFMPDFLKEEKVQTSAEMGALLSAHFGLHNKRLSNG